MQIQSRFQLVASEVDEAMILAKALGHNSCTNPIICEKIFVKKRAEPIKKALTMITFIKLVAFPEIKKRFLSLRKRFIVVVRALPRDLINDRSSS